MKKAQNIVEYALILAFVALICLMFTSKMDLKSIKNYVFMRPAASGQVIDPLTDPGVVDDSASKQINIEAMTK